MGIKQLFLILCCGLAAGRSLGQYPVQVMPQLTPPYSLELNDYYNSTVPKLAVVLTDRDLTRPSLNVRLKMTISGQSAIVSTIDNAFYPPITLDAGIPVRITGSELAPYFNPDNLSFQGITKAQYLSQGQLPEGYYQFCFQAIETTTGRAVSASSCAMAWLDLSDPPLLNLPSTASNVAFRDPLNIVFSWTPRSSGNPNSAFSTTYDFQLVEITDTTVDPTGAFTMLPPLYTATTPATTLLYGPGAPTLLTGHRYAWRVQAQAMSNGQQLSLFNNNGYSNVNWFTLEDNCQPPVSGTAVIGNGGVHISWIPQTPMVGYEVDYRLQGADTAAWFTEMATADSVVIYDVSPGKTYEYRIGGACSVGGGTTYGNTQAFTVPSQDTIGNPNCGILPNVNIANQAPLPALNVNDVFMAGDFPVKVLTTNGANGRFSGTGYVTVPFLGQAMVKVGWSGAGINTDYKLISGTVMTAFDASAKQVANVDSVVSLLSGFGTLINDLTKISIDDPYGDMTQLEQQIRQIAQQNLPPSITAGMDSAINNLNQAKLSYDSAKAAYDSLPDGPAKDSAQQSMQNAQQQFAAAQKQLSQVQAEEQQLVDTITGIIVKAIQQLGTDAQQQGNSPADAYNSAKQALDATAFPYTPPAAGDTSSGNQRNILLIDSAGTDVDPQDGDGIGSFITAHGTFVASKSTYFTQQYVLTLFNNFTAKDRLQLIGQSLKDNGQTLILSINDKLNQGQTADQIVPYVKGQLVNFLTQLIGQP